MPRLQLLWLGTPIIRLDQSTIGLETKKATALLAHLSVEANPQSRESLAAMLWPDHDAQRAPANLRRTLTSLRNSLGEEWLHTEKDSISFVGDISVDVLVLRDAVMSVRNHHGESEPPCSECFAVLRKAVTEYRGEFLRGLNLKRCPAFDDWQYFTRERIRDDAAWAFECLSNSSLAGREWKDGIAYARRWVELDALHEPAHRTLISLYDGAGKRSAAIRQYDECCRILKAELDDNPEPATQELADRIKKSRGSGKGPQKTVAVNTGRLPRVSAPIIGEKTVRRPRLAELLDKAVLHPVTLLSAPAGFGKSTLTASWAEGRDVAWLSLEQADNDPMRFLFGLVEALNLCDHKIGNEALQMLQSIQSPHPSTVLSSLLDDILRSGRNMILVLDDCHVLTDSESQQILVDLVDRIPENFHLILCSRMDPFLPLPRLRVERKMTEIRAEELKFRTDETSAFLHDTMGIDLQDESVELLNLRTEGWPAGLQMAALSLRSKEHPEDFVRELSGTQRHIADYLSDEVIGSLSGEVQDFLLRTSILDRFTNDLCNLVTDRTDSQRILERLEAENVFLIPLDDRREWYRYHHLFADLLRHRLKSSSDPEFRKSLNRAAAWWFEHRGDFETAMRHLIAGEHYEDAVAFFRSQVDNLLTQGRLSLLVSWVQSISESHILKDADACSKTGTVWLWSGKPKQAMRYFAESDALLDQAVEGKDSQWVRNLRGVNQVMRAFMADVMGDAERAIELAEHGDRLLTRETKNLSLALGPYILARSHRLNGNSTEAERAAQKVIRIAVDSGNVWIMAGGLHELLWLYRTQGRLRSAERALDDFDGYPRAAGNAGPIAKIHAVKGEIQREHGNFDRAEELITTAQKDVERWGMPSDMLFCHVLRCRLELSRNNLDIVEEEIAKADSLIRSRQVYATAIPPLEIERLRFFLQSGKLDDALEWAERFDSPDKKSPVIRESLNIAAARVLAASSQYEQAEERLNALAADAESGRRYGHLMEILLLQGNLPFEETARSAINRALSIGEHEGYHQIYLDAGSPVLRHLEQFRPDFLKKN